MSETSVTEESAEDGLDIDVGVSPDHPAGVDEIGFSSYTEALRILLTHQTTAPPLTISVEGPWGSGKTSFMNQLANKLEDDGHRTVEFNPWRHESEDALWAAFVLEFLRQLRSKDDFGTKERLRAELSLYKMRLRVSQNLTEILLTGSKLVALLLLTFGAIAVFVNALPHLLATIGADTNFTKVLLGTGGVFVAISAIFTILKDMKSQIFNPIRPDIGEYIANPDYEGRQAFITKFHKDFDQIIKAYTKGEERVFVFIDDLDRCEVPKAADLMQSINLLTESRPRIIFVIGIDRQKVASGVAAKHDDILPYITGAETHARQDEQSTQGVSGLTFGYEYLEKFIQLPFQVPKAKEKDMRSLLTPDEGPESETASGTDTHTTSIDPWVERELFEGESELLEQISEMVVPALNNNPRRVKKFGNLYRLQAILASQESILQSKLTSGFDPRVSLEQLAKFVVIRIHWRQFASVIADQPNVLVELEEYALGESNRGDLSTLAEQWADDRELMDLLRFGVDSQSNSDLYCSYKASGRTIREENTVASDPVRNAYSLQEVDLNNLIRVSPIIEEPEQNEAEQGPKVDDFEEYINVLREEISGEDELFFCNPEKNATHLRVVQLFLDESVRAWSVQGLSKELSVGENKVVDAVQDLRSHKILRKNRTVSKPEYSINTTSKVTKTLAGISNDLTGTGFKRRIKILAPMANLPNTTFPGELFAEELGCSENSIHHHYTQLEDRGILRSGGLPGNVGARYRHGMRLNTNNEIAQNLIELLA